MFDFEDESFLEKIKSWWRYTKTYKIEIPYRDFIRSIKNIIKWMPLIIKDADWDHRYIIEVLKFKIKNTADYIEKNQRHLDWKRDVKYMRIACNLIDKIWGNDEFDTTYELEYSDYNVSRFNLIPIDDKEKYDEIIKCC